MPEEITRQAKPKFQVFGCNSVPPGVKAQLAVLHCGYKIEKGLNSRVLEILSVYVSQTGFPEVLSLKVLKPL